jgi:hypothetical protein
MTGSHIIGKETETMSSFKVGFAHVERLSEILKHLYLFGVKLKVIRNSLHLLLFFTFWNSQFCSSSISMSYGIIAAVYQSRNHTIDKIGTGEKPWN